MIGRYVSIYNKDTDELVEEVAVSADLALTVLVSLHGDQVNDPEFYVEYPIDKVVAVDLLKESSLSIGVAGEDYVYYLTCG
ncbi:DUF7683 domain-containing protein [Chromobacterium haemolyticum]|uniref:DUF7683 domain-containing protein n=1 Tax=Chromobacterium haemolyticum TaxID=394935 RepID=UPI0011326AAD|nr:hypothetical protein [Chromobacterium haemolyticum]